MLKPIIQGSVAWQDLIDQGYVVISKEDFESLTKWRPIETAPEDGQDVLILSANKISIGWFEPDDGVWCHQDLFLSIDTPTHWMPLPEPPK